MAYTKGQQLKVNTSSGNLNMRASASSSGSLITSLPKGTVVTISDPIVKSGSGSTLGWIQVTYGSYTGYVSLDYMATVNTAAPAASTAAPVATPAVQTVATPAIQQTVAPAVQTQPAASSSSAQSIVAQKTAAMAENAAAAAAKAVEEMYNPAPSVAEPTAEPAADPQPIVVDAEPVSNGGSKTKKYLIIGGVVALVGIAGYLIFRKRK